MSQALKKDLTMLFTSQRLGLQGLVCAALIVLSGVSTSFAGAITTPAGLVAGDKFRIIFVTPTKTDATSSDISDYDAVVNAAAAGATFHGAAIQWQAVASTDTVNARDHIGQSGFAVYMADGTLVASNDTTGAGGLWSPGSLLAPPDQDLDGNSYTGLVWTGTSGVGTTYETTPVMNQPPVKWGLGNSLAETGTTPGTLGGYDWISIAAGIQPNSNLYQIYGISEVLVAVPEPSTLLISGIGLMLIVGLQLRKRTSLTASSI